jgi:hypothetical protein
LFTSPTLSVNKMSHTKPNGLEGQNHSNHLSGEGAPPVTPLMNGMVSVYSLAKQALILQVVIFERPHMFERVILKNAFSDRIIYRRTIFNSNGQVSIPLALVQQ